MKAAYALHQIIIGGTAVEPNSVFEVGDSDWADLLKLGAIRKPTAEEAALHGLAKRDAVEPASADRAELEARAAVAGVTFKGNITDAKLLERIVEAEAKKAETETGVTESPTNVIL